MTVHRRGVCALLFVLSVACGGSPPITPEEDASTFDVTWKPDAKVIEEVEVDAALVEATLSSNTFVFKASTASIAALAPGQFTVLGGLGVFKVLSITPVGENVSLVLEPALLTDVISDGTITWTQGVTSMAGTLRTGTGLGETDLAAIQQGLSGAYENGTLTFNGTIADFATSLKISPASDGFNLSMTAKYEQGTALANIAGTGTLRAFQNRGSIELFESTVKEFSLVFDRIEGDFTVEAGGVRLGTGEQKISIPARLTVPIRLGPIPARISVGGTLEVSSGLNTESSMEMKARFQFNGTAGIRKRNGVLEPLGELLSKNLTHQSAKGTATVDIGYGVLMSFPEISFGIGLPGTGGEAYFKVKNESLTNITYRYEAAGPYPVITGNCTESHVNLGAYYGGSLKVLDITLAEAERLLYSHLNPAVKNGDACK